MEGFKVKYVFFMIVLVLSIASYAAQEEANYLAKGGDVFAQSVCTKVGSTDIVISAKTVNIALIPETERNTANLCGYESIVCTDCDNSLSYSIIVVGFSKDADADKIILPYAEMNNILGKDVESIGYYAPVEIEVTYTHQVY